MYPQLQSSGLKIYIYIYDFQNKLKGYIKRKKKGKKTLNGHLFSINSKRQRLGKKIIIE